MVNITKTTLALILLAASLVSSGARAEAPDTSNGEWPYYTGDIKGHAIHHWIRSMPITLKIWSWPGHFPQKIWVPEANISLK